MKPGTGTQQQQTSTRQQVYKTHSKEENKLNHYVTVKKARRNTYKN
jgi:hypothetical protein